MVRGMSREIGKLNNETRKAGARPAWLIGPHREIPEQRIDHRLGAPGELVTEGTEGGERQAMLRFEHGGEQDVFALEVIVQRALGDLRRGRDLVHADESIAATAE